MACRWVVEHSHSWLNCFCRLPVRWEKKPEHDLAFAHFAYELIVFRVAEFFLEDLSSHHEHTTYAVCTQRA